MVSAIHLKALVLSGLLLNSVVLHGSRVQLADFFKAPGRSDERTIIPAECRQEIRPVRSVLDCSVLCGQSGLDCMAFIAYIHTNRLVSCEMLSCWFDAPLLMEVEPIPTLQLPYHIYLSRRGCSPLFGMTLAGNRCYQLYKTRIGLNPAVRACGAAHMSIANPTTVPQAHALLAWLELQDLDEDDQVWTNMINYGGKLLLSHGGRLSSHLWASGQPDGSYSCVTAMKDTDKFRFNDYPCGDPAYYVCEGNVLYASLQ